MMVNQVISVIGGHRMYGNSTRRWIVQIFYLPNDAMAMEGISYPGIKTLVRRGQIVLTPIPKEYRKMRRKLLLLQPWVWEAMLSDRVLVFGGNTVLCANSLFKITDFYGFDYIGTPWLSVRGKGGEGYLSLRNRTTMLTVLKDLTDETVKNQIGGKPTVPFAGVCICVCVCACVCVCVCIYICIYVCVYMSVGMYICRHGVVWYGVVWCGVV